MFNFFFDRSFRKSIYKAPIVKREKKFNPNELDWRPIAYTPAQAKYRFRVFSMRLGSTSRYWIGEEAPSQYGWNELSNPPDGSSFEESKDKNFTYVRMLKNGVPERDALIKRKLSEAKVK